MNTILRILALLAYPLVLFLCFLSIFRKDKFRTAFKNNYRAIIINTLFFFFIVAIGLVIFFRFENTIYAYDYSGHWIRALTLKSLVYTDPKSIFSTVYSSMNFDDYSYLPALFGLSLVMINESFGFFCISNLLLFLMPAILILNIAYFSYFKGHKYLPLFISVAIFPLYLTLFYGKVDCCGLIFIIMSYLLVIFPDFDDISYTDCLFVNIFSFISIFLRRWYLYAVICVYIGFFIKWLFSKRRMKDFVKIILSGLVLLVLVLLFFTPFLKGLFTNNFTEQYAVYNNDNKLFSFINNFSTIVLLIAAFGEIELFIEDKKLAIINLSAIVIPCILIWRIQSFEFHHYYIFLFNIIFVFTNGLSHLLKLNTKLMYLVLAILVVQPFIIFSETGKTMPFFTEIRKTPEVLTNKDDIVDFAYYIRSIETDESMTAYLASGSYGIISDDLLRNALLPDLDIPAIDSAVFDLRDGFPENFESIRYVILTDPVIYTNREYQHMFDIINEAITLEPIFNDVYNQIYSTEISNLKVTVYERTSELTKEMKLYLYDRMIQFYPDKTDFFSYMVE